MVVLHLSEVGGDVAGSEREDRHDGAASGPVTDFERVLSEQQPPRAPLREPPGVGAPSAAEEQAAEEPAAEEPRHPARAEGDDAVPSAEAAPTAPLGAERNGAWAQLDISDVRGTRAQRASGPETVSRAGVTREARRDPKPRAKRAKASDVRARSFVVRPRSTTAGNPTESDDSRGTSTDLGPSTSTGKLRLPLAPRPELPGSFPGDTKPPRDLVSKHLAQHPLFDGAHVEAQQQPDEDGAEPRTGQKLRFGHGQDALDGPKLQQHRALNIDVHSLSAPQGDLLFEDGQVHLPLVPRVTEPQLAAQAFFAETAPGARPGRVPVGAATAAPVQGRELPELPELGADRSRSGSADGSSSPGPNGGPATLSDPSGGAEIEPLQATQLVDRGRDGGRAAPAAGDKIDGLGATVSDRAARAVRQFAAASVVNHMTLRRGFRASVDVPELGRIIVEAKSQCGEVDVDVVAKVASTVAVLRSASHQLEQQLRNSSIELRSVTIEQATEQDAPDHSPFTQTGSGHPERGHGGQRKRPDDDGLDRSVPTHVSGPDGQYDGRVRIVL